MDRGRGAFGESPGPNPDKKVGPPTTLWTDIGSPSNTERRATPLVTYSIVTNTDINVHKWTPTENVAPALQTGEETFTLLSLTVDEHNTDCRCHQSYKVIDPEQGDALLGWLIWSPEQDAYYPVLYGSAAEYDTYLTLGQGLKWFYDRRRCQPDCAADHIHQCKCGGFMDCTCPESVEQAMATIEPPPPRHSRLRYMYGTCKCADCNEMWRWGKEDWAEYFAENYDLNENPERRP